MVIRNIKSAILIASILMLQFPMSGSSGDRTNGLAELPVTIVQWDNVTNRLGSSEVVILCLVDSYDLTRPSEYGAGDITPAQML